MPKSRPPERGPQRSASSSRGLWLIGAVAVVGVGVIVTRETCLKDTSIALPASSDGGFFVPAQHTSDEDGLALRTETTQGEGGTRCVLKLGDGEATLSLRDVPDGEIAFGKATIAAPDRERGTKFVEAFAKWLSVPVPPPRKNPQPLEPMAIDYTRLGVAKGGLPQTNKLFFPR